MTANNSNKHEIIMVLPEGDAGWQAWGEISGIACCDIFAPEHETALKGIRNNFSGILVLPLFAKERHQIIPFGLNFIKSIRLQEKNYNCTPLFLVPSEIDIPPVPVISDFISSFAKKIIKNPSFGNDLKAILFAELVYNQYEKSNNISNILTLADPTTTRQDAKKTAKKLLSELDLTKLPVLRELFYGTFVKFYEPFGEIGEKGHFSVEYDAFKKKLGLNNDSSTDKDIDTFNTLTQANEVYNRLNGIKQDNKHNVELEMFRAPIPFPLQELVDAEKEINSVLSENNNKDKPKNTIKLLLIDNKIEKIVNQKNDDSEQKTLGSLFQKHSRIADLFELRMLGKTDWSKMSELSGIDNFKDEESETFKFDKFGEELKAYKLKDPGNRSLKEFEYLSNIYDRIKKTHFVLLDFFLDNDDTYLAFDFIRDMADIKRKQGDVSTTWYFITSAVYDSVVKYSQSGLLAEYYESAVVNAGDDPTNEKRQIIFIYKLLTFIQARLRNFEGFKKAFNQSSLFKKNCGKKTDYCKKLHNCLYPIQALCRKYLGEYNEIVNIFPSLKQQETFKENIELTDNIINQFLWLPEADWPMIQRQIEHLNIRLEKETSNNSDGSKLKFSCKHILKELKNRSKIY